MHISTCYQK